VISKVETEINTGETIEITTKMGVEQACIIENKKKFQQTQETPCMKELIHSALGKLGEMENMFLHPQLQLIQLNS
jgi:hypothetical protein